MAVSPIFSRLFGRSPITSLQEHMQTAAQAVSALEPYFEAVFAQDWTLAEQRLKEIDEAEGRADDQKRVLRLGLPRSLFLPIKREDLLEMVRIQDGLANRAKDAAGIVWGRRMKLHPDVHEDLRACVSSAVMTCQAASNVIEELDNLVQQGFSDSEVSLVEKLIRELDDAEGRSDEAKMTLFRSLYQLESEMNPVDIMFTYEVIDRLSDISDRAQSLGHRVLCVIAH